MQSNPIVDNYGISTVWSGQRCSKHRTWWGLEAHPKSSEL